MRVLVQGRYNKVGNQWIAEIPLLYTVIASKPGEERLNLENKIKEQAEKSQIQIDFVTSDNQNEFFFKVHNIDNFLPIILKKTRLAKKLSIGDVTRKLGFASRNSYAQYEYGKTKLTFSKYLEFIEAMDPSLKVVLATLQ